MQAQQQPQQFFPAPKQNQPLSYPDGTRYFGQVALNDRGIPCPHGKGTLWSANGNIYLGQFNWGQRHGYGIEKYANGDKYEGTFAFDRFHGKGDSFRSRDQRRYVGDYVNGIEEGYAEITNTDSLANGGHKKYVGFMKGGLRNGQGTQYVTDRKGQVARLEGQWANGLLNGSGRQITSFRCLSGTFINGYLEGPGLEMDSVSYETRRVMFQRGVVVQYL